MQRRIFQFAILLLWLALPLTAWQYKQAWNQLPVHVATHFNAAGQANGWMSREAALQFGVGFVGFLLLIFTALLVYMSRHRVDAFAWAMLVFSGLALGFMVEVNRSIVEYNLTGAPVDLGGLMVAVPIAVVLLIVVYVAARREPPLPVHSDAADVIAEETHSGRGWSLLMLVAFAGPALVMIVVPAPALRFAMALVAMIGLAAVAAAWSGFQYRFLRHGVEIRALGFRLRSIPRSQIESYAAESWNALRGYGIRGVGRSRAYVWCNKVVHIKTTNGDVFLGCSDPERIVRDLDQVMGG